MDIEDQHSRLCGGQNQPWINLFVDNDLRLLGHIKFSMEPVAYTGFSVGHGDDGATVSSAPLTSSSPAFNVTLHATSTFRHAFCTTGGATLQAAFSGVTVAKGQVVAPFCVQPKESIVITGTVSSAWTAMPDAFLKRLIINRDDREHGEGGVEVEVNLSFENEFKGPMWVRCRAMLDANNLHNTRCRTFRLSRSQCDGNDIIFV